MTKSGLDRKELLFTIPEVRQMLASGGISELAEDVRLVTSNVAPLYRKTMRTVLAAAGIRVVANKKKYIIDVRVEPAAALKMDDVPLAAREEYYEIEVQDTMVTVRTATQIGALWGTHTLSGIYRARSRGIAIPNMKLRDWPNYLLRATYVRSLWGVDRMLPEEWSAFFEKLSSAKLNAVGIPLDGGRTPAHPETLGEGVLLPFPEHAEAQKELAMAWYSPNLKVWRFDNSLPRFHAEVVAPVLNNLTQVLNLAQENGLAPYPVVSGLGEATSLPRLLPATAAKDKAGKPLPAFCLSEAATRTVVGDYYAGMLARYFEEITTWFMVYLGDAAACQCAKCKKKTADALIREHLLWLLPFLAEKGVKQAILCDDLPAKLSDAVFSAEFAKQLDKLNLPQLPVLIRSRDAIAPAKKGAAPSGWIRWATPACTPAHWVDADKLTSSFTKLLPPAFAAGVTGTMVESVWDSVGFEAVEQYAALAWYSEPPLLKPRTTAELLALRLAADAPAYQEAKDLLLAAVKPGSPAAELLNKPLFAEIMTRDTATGVYDLSDSMAKLAGKDGKVLREQLVKIADAGVQATAKLAAILDRETKPVDIEMVRLLACESARIGGISRALLGLLPVWEAAAAKKADAGVVKAVAAAHAALLETLTQIETRRNKLTAPLRLAEISPLFGLTDQLAKELAAGAGKGKGAPLTWTWSQPLPPV